jgi:HAD superfamily hydrolase (TIGR01549 family)
METKAIIFDLYDTLVYCPKESKKNPYIRFFNDFGMTKDQINYWVNRVMTNNFNSFQDIKNEINPDMDLDITIYQNDLQDEIMATRNFDDTLKTLERLKSKYRIFCLSNLATPYKTCYFELGLNELIEKPFFSCDLGDVKPNKSFFNMVVEYSQISPNEIIMIGDNQKSDVDGAMNSGIRGILKDRDLSLLTVGF